MPHQDVAETNQHRAQEDKMLSLLHCKNQDVTGGKHQREVMRWNIVEGNRGKSPPQLSLCANTADDG